MSEIRDSYLWKKVVRQKSDGVEIAIVVQPNAKRTEVVGFFGEALKVKIHAPPVDGKANSAIIEFFSELLDRPKSNIEIKIGEGGRKKLIFVHGIDFDRALAQLEKTIKALG